MGGEIRLLGSSANQALLDVTGSAGFGTAGILSGTVRLAGDSAIEFKSGEITSLAAKAQLHLNGNDAFIEDSSATGSNSALTGLASIGHGAIFGLHNKAAVSTSGSLANDGDIRLDFVGGDGGSRLTAAALTNSGSLSIGNTTLSASDEVTATSLDNTGLIALYGSGAKQALLDVAGSAGFGTAGVLSGDVGLIGDSAIEFASGQITSLAAGASLFLSGNDAFIEDTTALGKNSALMGLATIGGAFASFDLENGASVSTSGALVNDGLVDLDVYGGDGGSSLTLAGALTNNYFLVIGNTTLSASDKVTAASLDSTRVIVLTGNGTNFAALDVSGETTNNGAINITGDTEELAGAVGGAGSFFLSSAKLQFDSSVSAGQTINETGANALILEQAQNFAAKISGFGTGDTIDATNFLKTATTYDFVENIAGTGGTLTLHDASLTANIQMTGNYSNSDFTLAPDSGTGTLVKSV
jgi:hypothetical protein